LVPPTTAVPPYLLKQDTYFGKIDIDGITYRVWKSGGVNSDLNIYVYSI
jgi:hypothetical protein